MDQASKRARCERCRSVFDFPVHSTTLCGPCAHGERPKSAQCFLCALSGGEIVKTLDGQWAHLVCALIACEDAEMFAIDLPKKRRLTDPPAFVHLDIQKDAVLLECAKCLGVSKPMPTAPCVSCRQRFHYRCFLLQGSWDYVGGFECGCRSSQRTPKRSRKQPAIEYEPIRVTCTQAPCASSVLAAIFEEIVKLDQYRVFRAEAANTPLVLPEGLRLFVSEISDAVLSYPTLLPQYHDDHTDTTDLTADLQRTEGVVESTEPGFVADFQQYERSLITSLDWLYTYRVTEHYYFTARQLTTDLEVLFAHKKKLCRDREAKKYVEWFAAQCEAIVQRKRKKFERAVVSDWRDLINQSKGVPSVAAAVGKRTSASRAYTYIRDFQPVGHGDLGERLTTSMSKGCDGLHCDDLALLGPFDLGTSSWKSQNECRARKAECTDLCRCDPAKCQNRQLTQAAYQCLGTDVIEQQTWGFDVLTYRTLMAYLRQPVSDEMHVFIGKKLPKAINRVGSEARDIRQATILIVTDCEKLFSLREKRYAQGLLNAIDGLVELLGSEEVLKYFRIHSKGTGVVCINKAGIKANGLIAPYIGELYSPSRWYELQDVTKSLVKSSKRFSGQLPDFYNIMLERHMHDPEGYDVLMIDPIVKGTFGSRLSHSCTPNCGTVVTVAGGRYTIGMYALEHIEYGQELTFDYHSVTESREEFSKAICLCASSLCRGHYLSLADSESPGFFLEEHGFVVRTACLVRSSTPLTRADEELLSAHSLRQRAVGSTPAWLQKWAAEVLRAVAQDCIDRDTYFWRLQNLVLTMDKVKRCLQLCGDTAPPLTALTEAEALQHLWGDEPTSVKSQLQRLYQNTFPGYYGAVAPFLLTPIGTLCAARAHLLRLRDHLRTLGTEEWACQGVADMLHLVAYTQIWVREHGYDRQESEEIAVRYCDVTATPPEGKSADEVWKKGRKTYSPTYIHNALTNWFTQCQEKCSMLRERRGTVVLPCLDMTTQCTYKPSMRQWLLTLIAQRQPWPDRLGKGEGRPPWGHFQSEVVGSPVLDSAVLQDQWRALEQCLSDIDCPAAELHDRVVSLSRKYG